MMEDDKKVPEQEPSSAPDIVEQEPTSPQPDGSVDEESRSASDGATEQAADDEVSESKSDLKEVDGIPPSEAADETVDREALLSRMESVVFASPEPMSVRKLANILGIDGKAVRGLATELMAQYENRGIILEEVSKGFQFRSHPKNAHVIRDVFKLKPLKLSKAALEALAIVAYRQPITRAEAEQIRGVDCGGVLKYLFEKELVRVIGRKEEPGRPIIYGTTSGFLELFGLKSLSDLPALHEFSELWEENQRIVDEEMPALEKEEVSPVVAKKPTTPPLAEEERQVPAVRTESAESGETGVENPSEIMDESNKTIDTEEESGMKKDDKVNHQKNSASKNPADVPTDIIEESEMKEILASIDAPPPVDMDDDFILDAIIPETENEEKQKEEEDKDEEFEKDQEDNDETSR